MRDPAPRYPGEGAHALWHVSENRSLGLLVPHVAATAEDPEPLVWAVDTRHLPLYWFPRDCPRGAFWAHAHSNAGDVLRLLRGSSRVHIVEKRWLARMQSVRLFAYRLPSAPFVPDVNVGGYWVAHEPVRAEEIVELTDVIALHSAAGIELRALDNLWPLWNQVCSSTLEYSGIRLRNAQPLGTNSAEPA